MVLDVSINGTRMNIGKGKEKANPGKIILYLTTTIKAVVTIFEMVFPSDISIKLVWRQTAGEAGARSQGPFRDFLHQIVT
jgi:hypothetical protein